jgi:hypothetical protein
VLHHFARSYTPGDTSYEARFWHARQLFVAGRLRESKTLFKQLRTARVNPEDRYRAREPLEGTFRGQVIQLHANNFVIARDGDAEWVMCPREQVSAEIWNTVSLSERVSFKIAFCLSGTVATDVERI